MKKIPIAHLHGGEVTAGATDEALRHAITKMSALHFTSTEDYRKRVLQLGEEENCVFNVGAIGIDNVRNLSCLSKKELEMELDIRLTEQILLVTFHPVTLENLSSEDQMQELLGALDVFNDTQIIFTMPNADSDGRMIRNMINDYVKNDPERSVAFDSLGRLKYLSLMKYSSAIVGNSSSGIIEAPGFGIPSVNIGDRQKGRVAAQSVIHAGSQRDSIVEALNKALNPAFKEFCKRVVNPYGDGHTAGSIVSVLKEKMEDVNLKKEFVDRI